MDVPSSSARASARHALLTAAAFAGLYLGLAALNAWPIPIRAATHLPHDLGDPVVSLTLLQWNLESTVFTDRWWDGVGFHPLDDTMTLSDARLGLTLLGAPIAWATGSPVVMYNSLFILSFALSGLAMHALVFSLTRSHRAAVVAGCAYAFAPFRAAHLAHLELLATWWMPLGLLGLHRWVEDRRARWLVLFAASLTAQGLFCAYYLPMFAVLAVAWAVWFGAGRVPLRQLAALGAAAVAGVVPLLPLFLYYRSAHRALGFARGLGEIEMYSADLSGLWSIPPELRLWPEILAKNAEGYLFPGLTVVALIAVDAWRTRRAVRFGTARIRRIRTALLAAAVLVGAVALIAFFHGPIRISLAGLTLSITHLRKPVSLIVASLVFSLALHPRVLGAARERSATAFYVLAAILMVTLALGPNPTVAGVQFLYKAPYSWLMSLPGFDESLRAPARFGMIAALALSVAAGLGWWRILASVRGARARWLTVAVAGAIVAEGWWGPSSAHPVPERFEWPRACVAAPRLELPLSTIEHDAAAQYRAMLDGVRSVNGTTGWTPPHMLALASSIEERDGEALTALAAYGPLCVAVDRASPDGPELSRWVASHPLAVPLPRSGGREFHQITSAPGPRRSGLQVGQSAAPLPVAAASSTRGPVELAALADGRPGTAWIAAPPQRVGDALTLSLACAARVETVAVGQGAYAASFARDLSVDVSADGAVWRTAWRGPTGGRTVAAALADPRTVSSHLQVASDGIRHIRLRLSKPGGKAEWAIAELAVLGSCGEH